MGTTSGSTGEPVHIVRDALSGEAVWTAVRLRDCEHHRIDPTKRLAIVRPFAHDPDDRSGIQRHSSWNFSFQSAGIFGERIDIAEFLLPARIVDEVVAFQPNYLQAASAELEMLCNWDRDYRLRNLGLEAVISYQDHMDERTRQLVGDHLQSRVINRYASEECGNIATTCAHCGRFHVHAESQFVEVVSDDGVPMEPGGTGWLLVTPLYNYAMPLIRYFHTDRVRVGRPGLCPITLTPFEEVIGKEPVLFAFPDNTVVRPILPPEIVARNLGAQVYQVVQVADDRCEFRIVPGHIPADEMRFEELTEYMRARWWRGLHVDYRLMNELPATGARKHLTFLRAMN
jgi:phenylacetate-CoA ligase